MVNKILIFRTSISKKQEVRQIGKILSKCDRIGKWNVDFEDWEKVLRIECNDMDAAEITAMLEEINIWAVELE
jgi:hypothetical protein